MVQWGYGGGVWGGGTEGRYRGGYRGATGRRYGRGGVRRGGKGGDYGVAYKWEVGGRLHDRGTGRRYGGVRGMGRFTNKAVHAYGSAYTRRCTQKAVCSRRRNLII